MGYLHIENLYKNQDILLFKECYALEKIHGTSAHITWKWEEKKVYLHSGGAEPAVFESLFNFRDLAEIFSRESPFHDAIIYGEIYGGGICNGRAMYGEEQGFIAFDVKINGLWLNVPAAASFCQKNFGIDFVSWCKITTDQQSLDNEMKIPSILARQKNMGDKEREGIILRPLIEVTKNNGDRIIAKHKGQNFSETKKNREISPEQLAVLKDAKAIAEEWVTPMRLLHVLDKLPQGIGLESTKDVIFAMVEDVYREAKGEIVQSAEAVKSIGSRTAQLFKDKLNSTK